MISGNESTNTITLMRMRRWVDGEVERLEVLLADIGTPLPNLGHIQGQMHALLRVKAQFLLTPEESAESDRVRREMFG